MAAAIQKGSTPRLLHLKSEVVSASASTESNPTSADTHTRINTMSQSTSSAKSSVDSKSGAATNSSGATAITSIPHLRLDFVDPPEFDFSLDSCELSNFSSVGLNLRESDRPHRDWLRSVVTSPCWSQFTRLETLAVRSEWIDAHHLALLFGTPSDQGSVTPATDESQSDSAGNSIAAAASEAAQVSNSSSSSASVRGPTSVATVPTSVNTAAATSDATSRSTNRLYTTLRALSFRDCQQLSDACWPSLASCTQLVCLDVRGCSFSEFPTPCRCRSDPTDRRLLPLLSHLHVSFEDKHSVSQAKKSALREWCNEPLLNLTVEVDKCIDDAMIWRGVPDDQLTDSQRLIKQQMADPNHSCSCEFCALCRCGKSGGATRA